MVKAGNPILKQYRSIFPPKVRKFFKRVDGVIHFLGFLSWTYLIVYGIFYTYHVLSVLGIF